MLTTGFLDIIFHLLLIFHNHLVLSLDKTLPLVLGQTHGSVHDEQRHHTPVAPECAVEAEEVQEERVELDGPEHVDGCAGATDTRGVGSEINN